MAWGLQLGSRPKICSGQVCQMRWLSENGSDVPVGQDLNLPGSRSREAYNLQRVHQTGTNASLPKSNFSPGLERSFAVEDLPNESVLVLCSL